MIATINKKVALAADFGTPYGSLATVGYTLLNGDGSTFQARTTTGVAEIVAATGKYRAELAATVFTAAFDGYVLWDTGGATPVYAVEDVFVSDRLDTPVSGVAAAVWAVARRTLTSSPRAED